MHSPYKAAGLAEFWGKRYNLVASNTLRFAVFEPLMDWQSCGQRGSCGQKSHDCSDQSNSVARCGGNSSSTGSSKLLLREQGAWRLQGCGSGAVSSSQGRGGKESAAAVSWCEVLPPRLFLLSVGSCTSCACGTCAKRAMWPPATSCRAGTCCSSCCKPRWCCWRGR